MIKVSFDFDHTLSFSSIQLYAKKLIEMGIEVWIITSRGDDEFQKTKWKATHVNTNDDLYRVARALEIPMERIHFTNYENKSEFIKDKGFLWHLDDDVIELSFINSDTNCIGVSCYKNATWRDICEDLIEKELNNKN